MGYGSNGDKDPGCLQIAGSALTVVAFMIGGIARCSADTSPEGNEFTAVARVTTVDEHDFTASIAEITDAHGKSTGKLVVGKTVTFYARYEDKGCSTHDVGEVLDDTGTKIDLEELTPGTSVEITGSVHADVDKCGSKIPDIENIPVFETAQVVHR